jgi:hypothetical protein
MNKYVTELEIGSFKKSTGIQKDSACLESFGLQDRPWSVTTNGHCFPDLNDNAMANQKQN